jgi:nicotinamidase-related amidase
MMMPYVSPVISFLGSVALTLSISVLSSRSQDKLTAGASSSTPLVVGAVLAAWGGMAWSKRNDLVVRKLQESGITRTTEGGISAGGLCENPPVVKVDVVVFIDPLEDFFSENGRFCETYGLEDTTNIRRMKPVLSELLSVCDRNKDVKVVLVTSDYAPSQFETIKNLCTTAKGTSFALTDVDDILSRNSDRMQVLRKSTNSILDCSTESRDNLLLTVKRKNVMICGVTSTACVKCAVRDLLPYCSRVVVTRDTIACRDSSAAREQTILQAWGQQQRNTGYDVVNHNCNDMISILDSWTETSLRVF